MKTLKQQFIIGGTLLIALWTAQTASAWYDPSTGRWLSRDPIGEPGFQALQRATYSHTVAATTPPASGTRWITRSPVVSDVHRSTEIIAGANLYSFVKNIPTGRIDPFGLSDCSCAPPLKDDSKECDKYGDKTYMSASLKCFCKCAGNSDWSQKVRGCLACEFDKGTDMKAAHTKCYAAAGGMSKGPILTLMMCLSRCEDPALPPPPDGGMWP